MGRCKGRDNEEARKRRGIEKGRGCSHGKYRIKREVRDGRKRRTQKTGEATIMANTREKDGQQKTGEASHGKYGIKGEVRDGKRLAHYLVARFGNLIYSTVNSSL